MSKKPGRLLVCGERPIRFLQALVDDLNDGVGSRIDENRLIVDDRVAISADAVFGRHVVIDDAVRRQDGAGLHRFAVPIGRMMFADDVIVKARTLIDAEQTVDAVGHPANDAANRTGGGVSLIRAIGRAADNALRLSADRRQ